MTFLYDIGRVLLDFDFETSIASLLLTTDAIITELPKKEDKKGGGHDHGGEDY